MGTRASTSTLPFAEPVCDLYGNRVHDHHLFVREGITAGAWTHDPLEAMERARRERRLLANPYLALRAARFYTRRHAVDKRQLSKALLYRIAQLPSLYHHAAVNHYLTGSLNWAESYREAVAIGLYPYSYQSYWERMTGRPSKGQIGLLRMLELINGADEATTTLLLRSNDRQKERILRRLNRDTK
ncbi:MAG: hypothetical protein ABIH46_07025 [Chloroflexota bacterium]